MWGGGGGGGGQFAQAFKEAHNENMRKKEEEERIRSRREAFIKQMAERDRQVGRRGGAGLLCLAAWLSACVCVPTRVREHGGGALLLLVC